LAERASQKWGKAVYSCNVSERIENVVEEMANMFLNTQIYY
jgi:hypothetical protein